METYRETEKKRQKDKKTKRQRDREKIGTKPETGTKRQKQRNRLVFPLYQLLTHSVTQEVKEWVLKTRTKINLLIFCLYLNEGEAGLLFAW